jgi:hypothetical protein
MSVPYETIKTAMPTTSVRSGASYSINASNLFPRYFFEVEGRVAKRCCTSPLRLRSVKRPAL